MAKKLEVKMNYVEVRNYIKNNPEGLSVVAERMLKYGDDVQGIMCAVLEHAVHNIKAKFPDLKIINQYISEGQGRVDLTLIPVRYMIKDGVYFYTVIGDLDENNKH